MNELSLKADVNPGKITANFDDIKGELEMQMTAYAELEITEDVINERKKDVAVLRKFKTSIDDRRKDVKKAYLAPYEAFENSVKELTGIIDTQVVRINAGLEEFEQKRISEKKKRIEELYKDEVGTYAEYLPLDAIYNPKWTNKTYSDNEIISDMQSKVFTVKNDLAAIKGLNSPYENQIISAYKRGGITAAMQKHADIVEAERAVERKKMDEAARKQTEEVKPSPQEEKTEWVPFEASVNPPVWTIMITGQDNIDHVKELLDFGEIPYEEV